MTEFQLLLDKLLEMSINHDRLTRKNYEDEAALCKQRHRIEDLEAEVESLKRSSDQLSLRNSELSARTEETKKRVNELKHQMSQFLNGDIVRLTVPPWPCKEYDNLLHLRWVRDNSTLSLSLPELKQLYTDGGVILMSKNALLTEPFPLHVGLANKKA